MSIIMQTLVIRWLFIYLFGVLRRFQHCIGHNTMGSWKGRGKQYIQFVRVLYCKLSTNGKQLPAFPLEAMPGTEPRPQRWEARVLPLWPLVIHWIQSTKLFTEYPPVINRLNFGHTFESEPELEIISGDWSHLYELVIP